MEWGVLGKFNNCCVQGWKYYVVQGDASHNLCTGDFKFINQFVSRGSKLHYFDQLCMGSGDVPNIMGEQGPNCPGGSDCYLIVPMSTIQLWFQAVNYVWCDHQHTGNAFLS